VSEKVKRDPTLWREMQEPHESLSATNAAVEGFFEELGALREKYRLADVVVVGRVVYLDEQGGEVEAMTTSVYGESLRAESMAAYAYGSFAAKRQRAISDMLSGQYLKAGKERK
jgi:hypothetical protein